MKKFNRMGETIRAFFVFIKERRRLKKIKNFEEYAQRDKLRSDPEYLRGHSANADGTAWKIMRNKK